MTQSASETPGGKEDLIVVAALRSVGLQVQSVYDLVNTKTPYPEAIPVLLEQLRLVRDDRMKEGVARALAVPEARPHAARPLLREFVSVPAETESQQHTKWAIAYALSVVGDDSVFEELHGLLRDRQHGWTRSGAVGALCNMKIHRGPAVAILMDCLEEEDLAVEAVIALGKLCVRRARPRIESFLAHPDSWIRKEAKKALARIDKAK